MLAARATIFPETALLDEALMGPLGPEVGLARCGKLFLVRGIGHAIAARLLGRVESMVRSRYHVIAGDAMRGVIGYAAADGHGPGDSREMMLFNLAAKLFRNSPRIFAGRFRSHNRKLIATVAANHI